MTTDPTRAAEIVVEQRHIDAAQHIYDKVPLFAMGHVKARPSHDLVQAFARFERDHMQRPTDTARAGERATIQKWRDNAFEAAATIVKRYVEVGGADEAAYAVHDILALHSDPAAGVAAIGGYEIKQTPIATPFACKDETVSGRLVQGAESDEEAVACLIWAQLCPGMVMGDEDLPHYLNAARAALAELGVAALASTPQPAAAETVDALWLELCEYDDRTSPEEYPDHALITRDELAEFIARAVAAERERCAVIAERETGYYPSGNMMFGPSVPRVIAAAIRQSAKGGE